MIIDDVINQLKNKGYQVDVRKAVVNKKTEAFRLRAVNALRKRQQERYAQGLCVQCGNDNHVEGLKICALCREKRVKKK